MPEPGNVLNTPDRQGRSSVMSLAWGAGFLQNFGPCVGDSQWRRLVSEEGDRPEGLRLGGIIDCTWRRPPGFPRGGSAFERLRRTSSCGALAVISIAVRLDPGHKTSIDQSCFPRPPLISPIGAGNAARPCHIFNPDKNITAVEEGQAEIKVV
jgi:hypothetical protein